MAEFLTAARLVMVSQYRSFTLCAGLGSHSSWWSKSRSSYMNVRNALQAQMADTLPARSAVLGSADLLARILQPLRYRDK